MNINWAAPTIDILNLDYPPIINVFRQPSEPFSLDSSHALTPMNPRVFQCIWNACMPVTIQSNHMQIYKHEYTRIIRITQSCYVIIQLIHQN